MSIGRNIVACVAVSWLVGCAHPREATPTPPRPGARPIETAAPPGCPTEEWPSGDAPSCVHGFTAVGLRCVPAGIHDGPKVTPAADALARYDALLAKQTGPPRIFEYKGTPDAIVANAKRDRVAIDSFVAKLEAVLAADDSPATHVRVRVRQGELHEAQRKALFSSKVKLRSKGQDGEDCGECGNECLEPSGQSRLDWRTLRGAYLQTLEPVMLRDYVDAALWARAHGVDGPEAAEARSRARSYTVSVGDDRIRESVRDLIDPHTGAVFRYVDSMFTLQAPAPLPPIDLVDEARALSEAEPCSDEERALTLTRLGEIASKGGDSEGAASFARRALRVKADAVPALLLLARDDIRRGRADHASATIGLVLDGLADPPLAPIDPSSAEAMELRGFLLLERGSRQKARDSLERAARLRSDLLGAPLWLGIDALSTGDVARAIDWLERAHRLAPNDVTCNIALGDAYRMSGRPADAEPLLASAVIAAPSSVPAHMGLGLLYLTSPFPRLTDVARLEAAIAEIDRAAASSPPSGERFDEDRQWAKLALAEAEAREAASRPRARDIHGEPDDAPDTHHTQ